MTALPVDPAQVVAGLADGDAAEPPRVGARYSALYTGASIALWMGLNVPMQVLIASQLDKLDPANKQNNLAIVLTVGAVVAMIANPVFGALSDASRFRLGRRRPWALVGGVGGALSLLVLGAGNSVASITVGWALCQLTLNILLAVLMAMVPDAVPRAQRGLVSGLAGIAQVLGTIVGMGVVSAVGGGFLGKYAALAVVLLAAVVLMSIGINDPHVPSAPRTSVRKVLKGFWVSPVRYPDFGWAWLTRFLVMLGFAVGTTYQLYYLQDAVGYEELYPGKTAEDGVFLLSATVGVALLLTAVVSGVVSDRLQRRKAFVIGSSVVIAAGLLILGVAPTWPAAIVAAAVLGAGFGMYLSVDVALITEVLPNPDDRGKDLGVINIANAAPGFVAPGVCAVLVTHAGGYPVMFGVAAAITLLGAVLVLPIKGVR